MSGWFLLVPFSIGTPPCLTVKSKMTLSPSWASRSTVTCCTRLLAISSNSLSISFSETVASCLACTLLIFSIALRQGLSVKVGITAVMILYSKAFPSANLVSSAFGLPIAWIFFSTKILAQVSRSAVWAAASSNAPLPTFCSTMFFGALPGRKPSILISWEYSLAATSRYFSHWSQATETVTSTWEFGSFLISDVIIICNILIISVTTNFVASCKEARPPLWRSSLQRFLIISKPI